MLPNMFRRTGKIEDQNAAREGRDVTAQIIALIVAGVLALVLRFATGTWAHPSALFAGAWAIYLTVPTLLLSELLPSPMTAWLIVAAILVASISARLAIRTKEVAPASVVTNKWIAYFVWAGSAAAALSAWVTQRANGISIAGMLSLDSVGVASRQLTALRYDGTMLTPALATILLALTFGAALAAPFAAAGWEGTRHAVLMCGPAMGGALYAFLTTARAPFLIVVAITVSSWLVVLSVTSGGRPRLPGRTLVKAAAAAAAVASVFVLVAASRGAGATSVTRTNLIRIVSVYAGGSIPAFESWQHDSNSISMHYGAQSFAGIAKLLLGDQSIGSAYKDFAPIGEGLGTNVYTSLRPLVEDFTLPGMYVAIAASSVIAALGYRHAVIGRSVVGAVIAAVCGAFVLFSQTTSIFSFTNVTVGLIVGGFLVCRFTKFAPVAPAVGRGTDHGLVGGAIGNI